MGHNNTADRMARAIGWLAVGLVLGYALGSGAAWAGNAAAVLLTLAVGAEGLVAVIRANA